MRLRAATELVGVGEAAAALQILQAVRAEDPPTLAELELVTARAWIFLGKREEAWRHLTAGLAMADATVLGLRAKLLAEKSRLLAFDNEGPASVRVAREALDLAGRAGDGHEASLRMVLATALYMTADPECIDHCRAALVDARRRGDTALESEALEALVPFISGFDDVSGALEHATMGIARARDLGIRSLTARMSQLRALLQLATGEHVVAIKAFRGLLEEPLWLGYLEPHTRSLLGLALADIGELGEADELVTQALEIAGTADGRDFGVYLRAEVAWLRGEPLTAVRAVDDYLASTPRSFRLAELEVVRAWALDDLGQGVRPLWRRHRSRWSPARCSKAERFGCSAIRPP